MTDTPRLPATFDTDRSHEPDDGNLCRLPCCYDDSEDEQVRMTDTPDTTPAKCDACHGEPTDVYLYGFAAGVAAERQRIRDWRARAVLDLLDGDTP